MTTWYAITIDGLAYKGEDPEREYDTNLPHGGGGLHNFNSFSALNELLIETGEPKNICGSVGLKGEIERIARRIKDGRISPKQIVIDIIQEPRS